MQLGDPRLSRDNRRRKDGRLTGGRSGSRGQRGLGVGRRERKASVWEDREREEQLALLREGEEKLRGE